MTYELKPRMESEITHNAVIYTYPIGIQDMVVSERKIFREPGWEVSGGPERKPGYIREPGEKSTGADALRSVRRAKAQLRRLALANEFTHFVTLTLDKEKIDRFDVKEIAKKLNNWTKNMVKRKGFRYILVPELHLDGAIHFHGFVAGDSLRMERAPVDWDGRPVYNFADWPFGFSTAQELYGDYLAAVTYCTKYISKQQDGRIMGRWYYSGGKLEEPAKQYADLDMDSFDGWEVATPAGRIKIANGLNL